MTTHPAAAAYAVLAPDYDRFNADQDQQGWAATLIGLAEEHGLAGRRLLDAACGTGSGLEPFMAAGFSGVGSDISAEMLALARIRLGPDVPLSVADLRELPHDGEFDLVLALADVLNYLLEPGDLGRVFSSVERVLARGGLFLFDVNTLGAYRTIFASDHRREDEHGLLIWRGRWRQDAEEGAGGEVVVEAFDYEHGRRATSRHLHRHHPDAAIRAAAAGAGLACRAVVGVTPDGRLHAQPDELHHTKRLYVIGTCTPNQ